MGEEVGGPADLQLLAVEQLLLDLLEARLPHGDARDGAPRVARPVPEALHFLQRELVLPTVISPHLLFIFYY